jgi:hypothetical protein
MRPKPPGLQPPRFTLVVQRCRRVRYRWRQWAWVLALAPAVRWLRRSHVAVAAVAIAGPMAVAVWYLPVTQGPRSAEPVPVAAPATAQPQATLGVRDALGAKTSASTTGASQPSAGPAAGEVAVSVPASAAASPEMAAAASRGPVGSLAPALSGLLQQRLSQLPDLGLPALPAVTLPAVPLPVAQLPEALLSQVNVPQLNLPPAAGPEAGVSQIALSQLTVSQLTASLPVALGLPHHS